MHLYQAFNIYNFNFTAAVFIITFQDYLHLPNTIEF